jgi:predicted secreted protein
LGFFIKKINYRRITMTTAAIAGYGTTLKRDGNAIAELTSISGPSKARDTIDVTNFGSPDTYREFIAGMKDGGEVGIEGNFIASDTDGQVGLDTDFEAGTIQDFIITFPDSTTWTFTAIVTKFETTDTFDGKVGFSASLKVSGKPTLGVTLSADITTIAYEDSVGAKTSLPVWVATTYLYTVTINTASTYIKLTVTDATAASIIAECGGVEYSLTTTVQSGQITVGAAATTTLLTVTVKDTAKSPKTYTIYVVRP